MVTFLIFYSFRSSQINLAFLEKTFAWLYSAFTITGKEAIRLLSDSDYKGFDFERKEAFS
jgi:hypothetical protein